MRKERNGEKGALPFPFTRIQRHFYPSGTEKITMREQMPRWTWICSASVCVLRFRHWIMTSSSPLHSFCVLRFPLPSSVRSRLDREHLGTIGRSSFYFINRLFSLSLSWWCAWNWCPCFEATALNCVVWRCIFPFSLSMFRLPLLWNDRSD